VAGGGRVVSDGTHRAKDGQSLVDRLGDELDAIHKDDKKSFDDIYDRQTCQQGKQATETVFYGDSYLTDNSCQPGAPCQSQRVLDPFPAPPRFKYMRLRRREQWHAVAGINYPDN
jgi:hypothetical protein